MFYFTLFLLFVYFKIARVHKKEEKMTPLFITQHLIIALSSISVYIYGLNHISWYIVLLLSLLYFIISALIVTAIQIGVFVDGKPQFGISKIYKILPIITLSIVVLSIGLWV